MEQSVPISSNTFWTPFLGTPFSKKRAPKIKPCFVSSSPPPCVSFPPPPSTTPKSIISHTHHTLFQCKHFFRSGLVYLVLLLDLNPFFSKLLPLSSHSCPLVLLSCFPFLLSFLSIPRFFRCSWRTASPTFTCDMIMKVFPSVSLLPLVHKCHFHSSFP